MVMQHGTTTDLLLNAMYKRVVESFRTGGHDMWCGTLAMPADLLALTLCDDFVTGPYAPARWRDVDARIEIELARGVRDAHAWKIFATCEALVDGRTAAPTWQDVVDFVEERLVKDESEIWTGTSMDPGELAGLRCTVRRVLGGVSDESTAIFCAVLWMLETRRDHPFALLPAAATKYPRPLLGVMMDAAVRRRRLCGLPVGVRQRRRIKRYLRNVLPFVVHEDLDAMAQCAGMCATVSRELAAYVWHPNRVRTRLDADMEDSLDPAC
jgi:hypothetical protein